MSNVRRCIAALVASILLAGTAAGAKITGEELVGTDAPVFTLASSQGRLIDYAGEYYGRHHLILTFFPAAFTPV